MHDHTVIFRSNLGPKEIAIKEIPSSRKIDADLEATCKETWKKLLVEAKAQDKWLWDSETYRFESSDLEHELFTLTVSTIPFSVRFPMNKHRDIVNKLGSEYTARGMFTSILIRTSDNQYVFIEKSDKNSTRKSTPFVGGVLSKDEKVLGSGEDLFKAAKQEIFEEIGISRTSIRNTMLRVGYINHNDNFCLLFETILNCTFQDVEKAFKKQNDGEAERVYAVSEKDISAFAQTLEAPDILRLKLLDLA